MNFHFCQYSLVMAFAYFLDLPLHKAIHFLVDIVSCIVNAYTLCHKKIKPVLFFN